MKKLQELSGYVIEEKYRLDVLIGKGGFGAVYKGEQIALNRIVAIKLMAIQPKSNEHSKSLEHRFSLEAKIISQLESKSTITVYDYGIVDGLCYLIMEFVDGYSLRELLNCQGVFDPARSARIGVQILDSLCEAHHHGVLHRDLKPANIMLFKDFRGNERVKVVDFGIAKIMAGFCDEKSSFRDLTDPTRKGVFIGTPRYSSPEQLFSENLSQASDIYSVGVIMWDMLVGESMISSPTLYDCCCYYLMNSNKLIQLPEEVDSGLAKVVERALRIDRVDRWQYAAEMKQALLFWLRESEQLELTMLRFDSGSMISSVENQTSGPVEQFLDSVGCELFDSSIDCLVDENAEGLEVSYECLVTPNRLVDEQSLRGSKISSSWRLEVNLDEDGLFNPAEAFVVEPTGFQMANCDIETSQNKAITLLPYRDSLVHMVCGFTSVILLFWLITCVVLLFWL